MFNTDTLGYKLISGKLKKHSEQLNKFLAGLLDADGYISADFCRNRLQIQCGIQQSESNDPEFRMMKAIRDHYDMGTLIYKNPEKSTHTTSCRWTLRTRESKRLFGLISKHLRIKGTHFRNIVEMHDELLDLVLTDSQVSELKEYFQCSRSNSKWIKMPKHTSAVWLAGYLAGDGHFELRTRRGSTSCRVSAVANVIDIQALQLIQKDYKGSINRGNNDPEKPNYNNYVWRRGLGIAHVKFSLPFLRKLKGVMCLYKKYEVIDKMIEYLTDKAQRLNNV